MTEQRRPAESKDLGKTIVDGAVKWEPAEDLALELGQLELGQLLDDGVWREVPVLRLIVGLVRTAGSMRERLFMKRIASFLLACPKFTEQQREAFARDHLSDPDKAKKLGDTLVLILERLDDLDKPAMLAKVFAALIRGKIGLETFRRLAAAIDIAFVEDLRALANGSHQSSHATEAYFANLLRTGLVSLVEYENEDAYMEGSYRFTIKLNPLGNIFIECMTG